MTKEQIATVLDRVRTWPIERQEDAVRVLLEMEHQGSPHYDFSDEELKAIEEGCEEAKDDQFAMDQKSGEPSRYRLTNEQVEEVKRIQKGLRDRTTRLATDEEMAALWIKCGL